MEGLSQTEQCIIRCYRRVSAFVTEMWFWAWTTALISANKAREILSQKPITPTEKEDIIPLVVTACTEDGGEIADIPYDGETSTAALLEKAGIATSHGATTTVLRIVYSDGETFTYNLGETIARPSN